jgi:hypothetical protein
LLETEWCRPLSTDYCQIIILKTTNWEGTRPLYTTFRLHENENENEDIRDGLISITKIVAGLSVWKIVE